MNKNWSIWKKKRSTMNIWNTENRTFRLKTSTLETELDLDLEHFQLGIVHNIPSLFVQSHSY